MDICKLCGQNKKLIESHIIPKWAFRYLYPEDPELKKQSLILIGKGSEIRRPIGPYDNKILCMECDNFIGKYDNYGKNILLDSELKKRGEEAYVIQNVDFNKLRLFLLSMIWRASISNKEEFERVSIGIYENKIKEILLNEMFDNIKMNIDSYSFVITKFDIGELPKDVVDKNIQVPHSQRIEGINIVVFYMPHGLKIFLKLDKRNFSGSINKISQYTKEGLIIPKLGKYSESPEFKSMLDVI